MTLRDRLIEAGAEALYHDEAKRQQWSDKPFAVIPPIAQSVYRRWSMELLDVFLDCLSDHADEWDLELAEWLLADLRDDPQPIKPSPVVSDVGDAS